MKADEARYSLWLLPAREEAEELGATMRELALLFGIPAFAPHATLHGDLGLEPEKIRKAGRDLAAGLAPLELRVRAVELSPEYFRSLFLRFEDDEEFSKLQELSAERFRTRRGLSPFPHLSLSYGEGPGRSDREALAEQLSFRFQGRRIVFPSIAFAESSSEIPIDQWKVLEEYPL
jgi:hypothetical protein